MTRSRLLVVGGCFSFALGAAGCSSSSDDEGGGRLAYSPVAPVQGQGGAGAGILTAGTWDDNQNFDFFMNYRAGFEQSQLPGVLPFDAEAHQAAHALFAQPLPHQTLDIALVIDTTGSMGDEIRYLQTEFSALAARVATDHPNAEQRWGLVAYKDVGDSYVVRDFAFSSDLTAFQGQLSTLTADGGGDYPEAPDAALVRAAELGWRTAADTARLSFWVADAPHHSEDAAAMAAAIENLQGLDVHVYPVASSGVDELTELTMRSAAQLTGGRYLFLTDDSGVGADHKEPTIPCYYVTKLNNAILRMVEIELSGTYREPATSEIVRTSGNPVDGACMLPTGDSVGVF
jgi:hypothetical protein